MKLGFGLSLVTQGGGTPAPFAVALTGLTNGEAIIGDHASISYTTDPVSATETVKWSNSANPADAATYGTGANPTDYTAGDEGRLYLHVTDTVDGETATVTRSALIRYARGTAPAVADGQAWTVDDTSVNIDGSASGANLTFTYAVSGLPAGVAINASSGAITGTPTAVDSGTATITATDQYGLDYTDTFTWSNALRTQATAADGLGPFNWTVDDTSVSVDATTDFTANGNTLTYTATGLPAGVTIATNGIISGTPTAALSGSIVITGQDEYGRETTSTTSHTTALRAQATGGADLDLSFAVDEAITATDLTANWTANGNTLTYAITGTALPAGLSVDSAGELTGTPTVLTADATYTLRGTDEYGRTTDDTFTLEVVAASAFTPADLFASGEEGGWWDIHPDYCFQNSDGTTAAGVGDPVGYVTDRSGNGNHLTQGTTASKPTLRQTGGGLYYLEFDGIDDGLNTPSINWGVGSAMDVFSGLRSLDTGGSNNRWLENVDALDGRVVQDAPNNGTNHYGAITVRSAVGGAVSTVTATNASFAPPADLVATAQHDLSDTSTVLRLNGSDIGSNVTGGDFGALPTSPIAVGYSGFSSIFANIYLFSLVVRGNTSTSEQISNTETYIADKIGVTL